MKRNNGFLSEIDKRLKLTLSPNSTATTEIDDDLENDIEEGEGVPQNTSQPGQPNPYPILHVPLPKKIKSADLQYFVHALLQITSNMQKQNNQLLEKVSSLESTVSELKSQLSLSAESSKKSFAEVVAKSVAKSFAAPTTQLSMMKAAALAQQSDSRKCAVIVRNAQFSGDVTADAEIGTLIAKESQVSGEISVFRIPLANSPPLLKLQTQSPEDARKLLSQSETLKQKIPQFKTAIIRPDLSKPELIKYRSAWKEVIRLNNEKQLRLYTVRNLEVVKIPYKPNQSPWPWTVKEQKTNQ
ncbi:unnamed protein product [Caenorhabditis nigoni]